jgi:signal transduction histidine kinase
MFEDEAREKHIQLGLDLDDPGVKISADPQQFEMVLLNLLRNAFDSHAEEKQDKYVRVRARKIGDRMHISIEDNGPGIAKELIDQVFVPFFSTKEKGSGIGLSLARQVMNKHEGSIQLESEAGKGTVVTLVFS